MVPSVKAGQIEMDFDTLDKIEYTFIVMNRDYKTDRKCSTDHISEK
jgi:hypothetical protein